MNKEELEQRTKELMTEYNITELLSYIIDLEQRIDKAIEFIKDNACYDGKECKCSFSSMALDKTLEILGDSNE